MLNGDLKPLSNKILNDIDKHNELYPNYHIIVSDNMTGATLYTQLANVATAVKTSAFDIRATLSPDDPKHNLFDVFDHEFGALYN